MAIVEFFNSSPFGLYTIHNDSGGPPGLYGYDDTTIVPVASGNDVRNNWPSNTMEIRIFDSGANQSYVVTVGSSAWTHTSNYSTKTVNVPPLGDPELKLEVDISTSGSSPRRQIIIVRRPPL